MLVCFALLLDQLRSRDRVTHPPCIKGVQEVVQDLLEQYDGRQWEPANIDTLRQELRTGAGAAEARYRAELDRKKRERDEEEEEASKRQRGDDDSDSEGASALLDWRAKAVR